MKFLSQIIQNLPEGLVLISEDRKIILWNKWMENKSGVLADKAVGRSIPDLFPDLAQGRIVQAVETALLHRQSSFLSHTINKIMFPLYDVNLLSNDCFPVVHNVSISYVGDESPGAVLIYVHDETSNVKKETLLKNKARSEKELNAMLHKEIEDRIKIEQKLKLSAAVLDYTMEGVVITDVHTVVESVNPAFSKITGYLPEQVIGKKIKILSSGVLPREYYKQLWTTLLSVGQWHGEFINKKPDGTQFVVESSIAAIADETGKISHYVNVFHDITQRKKDEEQLEKLSRTDGLTGLANRRVFDEAFAMHWSHCIRHKRMIAVVMIDVDHFKLYNDCYGHLQGDDCLKKLAKIFADHVHRAADVIARYGGEEFVAILLETTHDGILTVAENMRHAVINAKIPHEKSPTFAMLTISAGASFVIPDEKISAKDLLAKADEALYEAKRKGRNQVVICELNSARG